MTPKRYLGTNKKKTIMVTNQHFCPDKIWALRYFWKSVWSVHLQKLVAAATGVSLAENDAISGCTFIPCNYSSNGLPRKDIHRKDRRKQHFELNVIVTPTCCEHIRSLPIVQLPHWKLCSQPFHAYLSWSGLKERAQKLFSPHITPRWASLQIQRHPHRMPVTSPPPPSSRLLRLREPKNLPQSIAVIH